jgi:hypothetical protein
LLAVVEMEAEELEVLMLEQMAQQVQAAEQQVVDTMEVQIYKAE